MMKYNFSPGPSKLNKSIIETIKENILEYGASGVSILEISHRSDSFDEILSQTKKNLIKLFNIPNN